MKKSEIKFTIELDDQNIPEKIFWEATDSPSGKAEETKAFAVSLWDQQEKTTMRIDLWAKDMPVNEMQVFYLEMLAGMGDTLFNATGDEYIQKEMKDLVKKLFKYIEEKNKGMQ